MAAVKVSVPAGIPAVVGLPRNHSAEPGKAGAAVIIGIHERATPRGRDDCLAAGFGSLAYLAFR